MKATKYIFASALAFVLALGFSSCSDKDDYSLGEKLSGAQVYFPGNEASKKVSVTFDDTSFSFDLARRNSTDALTVPLTITGNEQNLLTIPTSANFAAGQSTTTLNVTFDANQFGYDNFQDFDVKIGDETYSTPYGLDHKSFSIGVPAPWAQLISGKDSLATYREDFMTTFFAAGNPEYEVVIEENQLTPGYYRLVNPYGKAYPNNEEGDWDDSQDWYLEIHAEDPDHVYITTQDVGMDWGYGNFLMGSLAGYYVAKGASVAEIEAMGDYFGKLENGVITFPDNSLLVGMTNYNGGGLYKANSNGMFRVILPGATVGDFSIGISYAGKYTNANEDAIGVFAQVDSIGADVESVKYALVRGTDVSSAVSGIKDGSIESVEATAKQTRVEIPADEPLTDGKYTIVAVTYAGGSAREYSSATFKYASANSHEETWSLIGTGNYTYTVYFGDEDDPYVDEGLELYVSDDDDTRYKITHWGYDVDFIFTYNSETGEVRVEENETGYTIQGYGDVYVSDMIAYTGYDSYGTSSYANGTFTFTLIYYVSAGGFGYGTETFTITNTAAAAKAAKVKKSTKVAKGIKATMAKKAAAAKKHSLKKSAVKSTFKTPSAKALKS
jgi:hypothetical protein